MNNQVKTLLLLTALSAVFLWIGNLLGGSAGMMTALFFSLAMNFSAYWFSDKIILSIHRARLITREEGGVVLDMVEELSRKAGLPMPKVYWIPDRAPNAFATGRNPQNAAIAVTQGLLEILDKRELKGVLAHELGHVANNDILLSTIVATGASAIMYLAHMLQWVGLLGGSSSRTGDSRGGLNPLVLIFTVIAAPIVATLIQTAISRAREFMADEKGALVAEDPEALASALEKISDPKRIRQFQREETLAEMQPAFGHLYIVNHFSGQTMMSWFSTHPPVQERVRRLRALSVS